MVTRAADVAEVEQHLRAHRAKMELLQKKYEEAHG
jgi:hypothetical protein